MKTEAKSAIFIIGGTGYIGGSILHLMTETGYPETFEVSASTTSFLEHLPAAMSYSARSPSKQRVESLSLEPNVEQPTMGQGDPR